MKLKMTVLGRICLLFFALVIPWSVLSFCLLQSASHRIEETSGRMVEQTRHNAIEQLETKLANTYTAAMLSDTLHRATALAARRQFMTDYERAQATDQLFESLTLLNTMGDLADSTRVYILPLQTIYNYEGFLGGSVQAMPDEAFFHRMAGLSGDRVSLSVDGGRILMLLKNNRAKPTCVLEVELSRYYLTQYLKNILEFPDSSLYRLQIHDEDVILQNLTDEALYIAALEREAQTGGSPLTAFTYDRTDYYLYTYCSKVFDFTYREIFPASLLLHPARLSGWLTLLFALLSVIVLALFFAESVRLIHLPLRNLANSFSALRQGDFTVRARSPEAADFVYLYDGFNHMAGELETLVTQNYQQKILLQTAELRQLQAQINPHFLYNSFFLLQRVISLGDTERAEQIAGELGVYFRYITKQNSDTVLLREEAEHARIYANIQSIRFSRRIRVEFGPLPESWEEARVPKLFLQPLIENAFQYGLENKLSGGILRAAYEPSADGRLVIRVEDNGEELTDRRLAELVQLLRAVQAQNPPAESSGILNIARRLQIYYQSDDCFSLDRSPLGGLRITIRLWPQG